MKPLYNGRKGSIRSRSSGSRKFLIVGVIALLASTFFYFQFFATDRDGTNQTGGLSDRQAAAQDNKDSVTAEPSTLKEERTAGSGPESSEHTPELLPVLNTAHIKPPDVSSPSAIIIDRESGLILYQKNSREVREIASLTKIMTAMLAYEMGSTSDTYSASENSTTAGGSELYLEPGEKLSGQDMFYALMLRSANDVSIALAEALGGSEEHFVSLMNERSEALGLKDTVFYNPHGLDRNVSTAYDMAVISREAMKDPFFRQVVGTKRYEIPWPGNKYPRSAINHNRILGKYAEVKGIKTGLTEAAGYCLAAAGEKDGMKIITVILGAGSAEQVDTETMALFDHAFDNFKNHELVSKNDTLVSQSPKNAPMFQADLIVTSDVMFLDLKKDPQLTVNYKISKPLMAPVRKGQKVGVVEILDDSHRVTSIPLVSKEAVNAPGLWDKVTYFFNNI